MVSESDVLLAGLDQSRKDRMATARLKVRVREPCDIDKLLKLYDHQGIWDSFDPASPRYADESEYGYCRSGCSTLQEYADRLHQEDVCDPGGSDEAPGLPQRFGADVGKHERAPVDATQGGQVRKILYIDMDNVLVDFGSALDRIPARALHDYEGRLDEVPGIFGLMDPTPGAVEAYNELAGLFDTYVLSTSPWENPSAWSDKLQWVKRHLGASAHKRLILTHHKDLNRGDFLVDDRTKNGASEFQGELIRFGTEDFPDWSAVVVHLRPRA
jgi:5'-nucleotidase